MCLLFIVSFFFFFFSSAWMMMMATIIFLPQILFLEQFCNPLFVFPYKTSPTSYSCVEASVLRALYISAYGTAGASLPSGSKPLSEIILSSKRQRRPVVLFLECARTNGDGVLEFPVQVS